MEIVEVAINAIIRLASYLGLVHFIEWSEKWIHKYLLPKSWQMEIADNSDLMHAIAIIFWVVIVVIVIFVVMQFFEFLQIDSCLDSGGRWNYEKEVCENGNI
jgi:hypothetical protein